jgi:ABC-type transport system involved in multi-copper enzyme maturation permease subunit
MNALRGEWTKLRTVPRWVMTFVGVVVVTVGLSALGASGSGTDANVRRNFVVGPGDTPVSDEFGFVHQPVTGDTSITVHVSAPGTPTDSHESRGSGATGTQVAATAWTDDAAGVAMKDGVESGSSYVSLALTAENGVRMQSDFSHDVAGSSSTGARWLRLTREGRTVTGFESADGVTWQKVATMTPDLPDTAEVGLMVSSAPQIFLQRGMGGSSLGAHGATADATFDHVTLDPPADGTWQGTQVTMPIERPVDGPDSKDLPAPAPVLQERSGTYTVTGSGKVGPQAPDDDVVEAALIGVIAGLMALIAVGALFGTSEYRRSMIRTTFAAEPRRGRVLAAKAIVLGGVSFVVSLVSVVGSFLVAVPILQGNGMAPPAFPDPSLTDWPVLRTLLLTALFMTGVAVFALAVGMLLRRSAAAITLTIGLVLLPLIAGIVLPGTSPRWLLLTTLAGGMAVLRSKPVTESLAEPWALIAPAAGISIVLVYAAGSLGLAWWRLRRRDA